MALTTEQQSDIRADLGITASDQTVFTDAEFDRLYERAESEYARMKILALEQLLMDAAKRNSYSVGQTQEKLNEVFDNLLRMLNYLRATALNQSGAVITGTRPVPYAPHGRPYNSNSLTAPFPWRRINGPY